jgi:hypothetical protein
MRQTIARKRNDLLWFLLWAIGSCIFFFQLQLIVSDRLLTHAQGETATLSGRVTDASGAVVVGAEVQATNVDTNVVSNTKTNEAGIFFFPSLLPGNYRLSVKANGFREIVQTGIVLHVQDRVAENLTMQVGSVDQRVTVAADQTNIDTEDASVGTVIDRNFAENLPLNGRSFQSLIYLTPGVSLNITTGFSSMGQFTVNGQRASSNYWTVDGVSANIGMSAWNNGGVGAPGNVGGFNVLGGTNSLVSVDALQEFRIQTSTYAPEFGRVPGGQVSIVTRSGTNQFHGTLFDYFRNTVLDAEDWFASSSGLPKAAEQQNNFGGVLGGPIIKDKTFFFFSYEGLRLGLPQTGLTTVPDLTTRADATPAMQPYLNAYPRPNGPEVPGLPGVAEFNATYSNPATVNAYSLRVDHALTKSLNLFGRYNHSPSNIDERGGISIGIGLNTLIAVNINTDTGTVGATWTKSAQVVDEIRFNYSYARGSDADHLDTFGGGVVPSFANVFPASVAGDNPLLEFEPSFGTGMFYAIGVGAINTQHQYNVVDTLSVQRGPHSLKFGVDYRRLSPYVSNFNSYASVPVFADIASLESGNTSFTFVDSWAPDTFLFHNLSAFGQDTWRVNPRLTLTYGLRWDVDFAPTTENNPQFAAVTGFSYSNPSNLALASPGTPIFNTTYGSFAPRVGVAYQISQKPEHTLVLRSGFGVFYDMVSTEAFDIDVLVAYPFFGGNTFTNTPFPTLPAVAAPPAIIPPNASQGTLVGFDPHLNVPYTLEWSAALEQGLGKDQTFTLSYLGSSGRRLLATEAITAPNANYAAADLVGNAGTSSYNALQAQFQRRLSKGLQTLLSYTWSHSIDDGSYGAYTNGTFANINVNKGDSDYDVRNTFSGALTYEVPVPSRNAFVKAIMGGWSSENIIQVHSAPPINVVDAGFFALTRQNSSIVVTPDVVAGQRLYLYGPQYPGGKALNPGAFTSPPVDPTTGNPQRQGDLGRNSLRGFGLTQWDFAIHRDFALREKLKLQFRAEMFNVLNHPNFGPFDTNFGINDPNFGKSTAMLGQTLQTQGVIGNGGLSPLYQLGGPRDIQLALKLSF